jgi:hypothetical protein
MPGLVPGIHVLSAACEDVDGRDKPGHDEYAAPRNQSSQVFSLAMATPSRAS